jgi:hypothetical protein
MACPLALRQAVPPGPWNWQQEVYRRAYQEALAVVRPSVVERLQASASAN